MKQVERQAIAAAAAAASSQSSTQSRMRIAGASIDAVVPMQVAAAAAAVPAAGLQEATAPQTDAHAEWKHMRLAQNWPDGQTRLESMYSPYQSEGIADCPLCQPRL
jgi:hypothetical protein